MTALQVPLLASPGISMQVPASITNSMDSSAVSTCTKLPAAMLPSAAALPCSMLVACGRICSMILTVSSKSAAPTEVLRIGGGLIDHDFLGVLHCAEACISNTSHVLAFHFSTGHLNHFHDGLQSSIILGVLHFGDTTESTPPSRHDTHTPTTASAQFNRSLQTKMPAGPTCNKAG
eukprot:6192888-Pleurochrysis_carterae.AAC.2